MAKASVTGRIVVPNAPALAMAKGFKGYKPEEEKIVRKAEVVEDEALKQLKDAFRKLKYRSSTSNGLHLAREALYWKALEGIMQIGYSASNIERFSLALAEFQNEKLFGQKAGFLLSALMNNAEASDFVIHTRHLQLPPDYLGYKNTKNITVKGNINDHVGDSMKGGTITVEGDARDWVGSNIHGGAIIVKGNAGRVLGLEMKGGSITVEGNAGDMLGWDMKGGEIHVEGGIENTAHFIEHGKIFHKGRLIVGPFWERIWDSIKGAFRGD